MTANYAKDLKVYFNSFRAGVRVGFLDARGGGLRRRLRARRQCCAAWCAAFFRALFQSLLRFPRKASASPKMPRLLFHPLRLARKAAGRPGERLLLPERGTGTSSRVLRQIRVCAEWTSPEHKYWTGPARDRLAHIEWACACRLGQVVPGLNHPQIRPWSGLWTAGG